MLEGQLVVLRFFLLVFLLMGFAIISVVFGVKASQIIAVLLPVELHMFDQIIYARQLGQWKLHALQG